MIETIRDSVGGFDAEQPGLWRRLRMALRPQAQTDDRNGWLVPANTTWSQIMDYASGSGDLWPFDLYQVGLPLTRDVAVAYATLNRCVTLTAGAVAQLVCGGGLRIVDSDGRRRTSRRADRVLEVLSTSADNGVTPSHSLIEDAVADYCLDGNALFVPAKSGDGMLQGLRRFSSWDTHQIFSNDGTEAVYRLTPVDGREATEYAAARDVIHVRWPRLLRYGRTRSTRAGFAVAPVVALRPALDIGLQGDRYIREWFAKGSRSKIHFNLGLQPGETMLTMEQRRQLQGWIQEQAKSGRPMVTQDMTSTRIDDTPQDSEAAKLRDFQVQEVGRYYGIPAPLLGMNVTQWGQGIEQLMKLWLRVGLRDHAMRFLAPFQIRLLRPGDRFLIDPTEVTGGDYDAIAKLIMAVQGDAQRPPIATREEMRHIAGLPRDPDGEFMQVEPKKTPPSSAEGIVDPDAPEPE